MPLDGTGNGLWSISVEEQFYLFLPLGIVLGQRLKARWPWFAAILILMTFGAKFMPIAFGVLAATMADRFGAWHLTNGGRSAVYAGLIGASAYIAMGGPASAWVDAIFGVTVVLTLAVPGQRSAWGQFFGGISYPLYLNAWIGVFAANLIAKKLGLGTLAHETLICLLAFCVATASWYFIDRNIMARRGAWYHPRIGALVTPLGYALTGIGLIGGFFFL